MSSGVADYGASLWLGALFGLVDLPTEYWVALCSDAPGPGGDGDTTAALEPAAGLNYGRLEIGTGVDNWGVNGPYLANLVDLDWPVAFEDWGRITHYALLDSQTSGNLFGYGEMNNPQYVSQGFALSIPAGGLIVNLGSNENPIVY